MIKALSLGENPGIEALERRILEPGEDTMICKYFVRNLCDVDES